MINYRVTLSNSGKLICFKSGNGIKQYKGKDALDQLEYIKGLTFNSFKPLIRKNNKSKTFGNFVCDIEFNSNDIKVSIENIFNYNQKVNMIDSIKQIINNIKIFNIEKKKEELINQKELLLKRKKNIAKFALASTILASIFTAKEVNYNIAKVNTVEEYDFNNEDIKYDYQENKKMNTKLLNNNTNKYINNNNIMYTTYTNTVSKNNTISNNTIGNNTVSNNSFEKLIEEKINFEEHNIDNNNEIIENSNTITLEYTKITNVSDNSINNNYNGMMLTSQLGRITGPSGGEETYYDLDMGKVVQNMRMMGYDELNYPYWIRDDGCKMLGEYVMVAANLKVHPRGSYVQTSLGTGLVCDTGDFASNNKNQIDIATNWTKHKSL